MMDRRGALNLARSKDIESLFSVLFLPVGDEQQ